jgi:hypothetical protein
MDFDRRLAPSVMGALQISALDEQRDQFRSTEAIEPGMSPDRRFLQVWVAGAHSNIGGSYWANGLSDRSFNLAAEYLNSLSDTPLFTKRAESQDPALNVIHRSHEHQWFYTERGYKDGIRDVIQRLAPNEVCRIEARACVEREPIDVALASTVEFRQVRTTPNPLGPAMPAAETANRTPFFELGTSGQAYSPQQSVDELFNRLAISAQRGDAPGMRSVSQDYVRLESGQQWLQDGREQHAAQVAQRAAEVERQAATQREAAQAASAQTEAAEVPGPAMRR